MSRIPSPPRIHVTISVFELLSLSMMLKVGKTFTRPAEREQVEAVFSRIGKKLEALGVPRELVDKLVKL